MNRHDSVAKLVELAGSRIDIFYHFTTNTHIVCQKREVTFYNYPIKGTGDFADDAHQNFLANVESLAHDLDDTELVRAIELCENVAPACTRKFELQVAISEDISSLVKNRAKLANKSLARFLEELVSETLPEFESRSEMIEWASSIKKKSGERASVAPRTLTSQISFALPLSHGSYDRVNQVVKESGVFFGLNEMIEDVIAFRLSEKIPNSYLSY